MVKKKEKEWVAIKNRRHLCAALLLPVRRRKNCNFKVLRFLGNKGESKELQARRNLIKEVERSELVEQLS